MAGNVAFDWQFINYYFHRFLGRNPFGFSGRRIGDLYAGMVKDASKATEWKKYRVTKRSMPLKSPRRLNKRKLGLLTGIRGSEDSFVDVIVTDEESNETSIKCVVEGTHPSACLKCKKHKWESPHEVVGGFEENPGEWSIGGGRFKYVEVCCHCGCYRTKKTESLPDQ
jgi:hypothetical protein